MKTHLLMYLCGIALLFTACSSDEPETPRLEEENQSGKVQDEPKPEDEDSSGQVEEKTFVSEKDFNEIIVGKYWKTTREGGRYNAKGEREDIYNVVGFNDIEAFYIDGSKFRRYGNSVYRDFCNYDISLYDGKTGILYTVNDRHTPIHFEKIEDGKVTITFDYNKGIPRFDENGNMYWEEGSYVMEVFRPASEDEMASMNDYQDRT